MTQLNPLNRKGIIMANDAGQSLYPLTQAVSKRLIPVYDKPMIYYPLCNLIASGITEVGIMTSPDEVMWMKELLGDGSQWNIRIEYFVKAELENAEQIFTQVDNFLAGSPVAIIAGDSIFYGHDLVRSLQEANAKPISTVFAYHVADPSLYPVVEFNESEKATTIRSASEESSSNYAIAGIYFLNTYGLQLAKRAKFNVDAENPEHSTIDMADLLKKYLERDMLNVEMLGRGTAWLDINSQDSLLEAASFVRAIEKRQGLKISSVTELTYQMGLIDADRVREIATPLIKSGYGEYLMNLVNKPMLKKY